MKKVLASIGVTTISRHVEQRDLADGLNEIIREVMVVYEDCLRDPDLRNVAYGCAVGAISLSLEIPLKTARLLFEHALVLKENLCLK